VVSLLAEPALREGDHTTAFNLCRSAVEAKDYETPWKLIQQILGKPSFPYSNLVKRPGDMNLIVEIGMFIVVAVREMHSNEKEIFSEEYKRSVTGMFEDL